MSDIDEMKEAIDLFIKERDWERYHTPKDIVLSLTAEVGELLREFQWMDTVQEEKIKSESNKKKRIEEELSDVLFYVIDLSRVLDIDLKKSFMKKMEKNRKKYPKEVFKGKYFRPQGREEEQNTVG